jgi:hypothetical protein
MRGFGLAFLVLSSMCVLVTAAPVMRNICNSAPQPGGTVWVNADIFDTLAGPGPVAAQLMYSTDDEASWTTLSMTRIAQPGYDSTFAASFPMPGSGAVYYYLRANEGVSYASQSPLNTANTWPPPDNLLVSVVDEPAGDTVNAEGPHLDLTGTSVGYSSDYVYALITNNSGNWPLYRFPTPWYIYTVAFMSRQMPTDSFAFALTHANVVGLFSTGLVLFNRYLNSFERIADIDVQTSGNRLYMRGRWSDMTSRPEFGPWPNSDKFLTVGAGTASFYGPGSWYARDFTDTANFYCLGTPVLNVGENTPPVLASPNVAPRTGPLGTSFNFTVRYTDANNNLPVLRAVVVDAETISIGTGNHKYSVGVDFNRRLAGFAVGVHQFHFVFDDGMSRVTTPPDSFEVTGTAIAENPGRGPLLLLATPNPFRERVRFRGAARAAWLEIRSDLGRLVRRMRAASDDFSWDGCDDEGRRLPAGLYFARLREAGKSRRIRLIKLNP